MKILTLAAILAAAILVPSALASSPRSGDLTATKECSGFNGNAGSFCTITSSNLAAIGVGSKIVYLNRLRSLLPQAVTSSSTPPGLETVPPTATAHSP